MQLPEELQIAIEQIVSHSPLLQQGREALTQDYKAHRASSFGDEAKRLAYLGARMPATYAAIHKALEEVPFPIPHLLDLGAGPGTASWAATSLFPSLQKITLVERSHEAIALGQKLATFSPHPALQSAQWLHQSVTDPFPAADAAVLSYVLNEVEPSLRSALIAGCWERVSLLVLVEPGTPQGFEIIRKAREQLIALRAHLIAPCPHALACPMQRPDWCHFAARVERTRLHRYLKEGTLGYEDEKFSYLVAAKMAGPSITGRLVRPPLKQSGHVRVTVCSNRGQIEEKVITRKDKAAYRNARKAEWGDSL